MVRVEAVEDDPDAIYVHFDDESLQGSNATIRMNGEHAVELTLQLWELWSARGYDPDRVFAALAAQRKSAAPAAARPSWWAWLLGRKKG